MTHRKNTKNRVGVSEGIFAYEGPSSRRGMMTNGDGHDEEESSDDAINEHQLAILRKLISEEVANMFASLIKKIDAATVRKKFPEFFQYVSSKASNLDMRSVKFVVRQTSFLSKGQPFALLPDDNRTVITWVDGRPVYNTSETVARAIERSG